MTHKVKSQSAKLKSARILKIKFGFTLIELLVVIGLLVLTIAALLDFFIVSLKGSNQVNVTAEVKQNGQAVLDSLERQIRNAGSAVAITPLNLPSGALSGVNLSFSNGDLLYIVCFNFTASTNGWIGVVNVPAGTVVPPTFDGTKYKSITSTDTISGVDITGCTITVTSSMTGESPEIVRIAFTANQGVDAPSRKDFRANAQFQTTISLRHY